MLSHSLKFLNFVFTMQIIFADSPCWPALEPQIVGIREVGPVEVYQVVIRKN
jgi:hypothetical protein